MRRALGALLATIGCALVVAACGSSDSDTGKTSGTTAAAKPAEAKKLSGTVTVWDSNYKAQPGYTKAADKIDAAFEAKYPGVKVEHLNKPYAEYNALVQAAFTSRRVPDVLQMTAGEQSVLHYTAGLEPLSKVLPPETKDYAGFVGVQSDYASDGEVWGVPVGAQANYIYYNKKLFAKAGLDPESPPKTWDDFVAAGEKLKAAGIPVFSSGEKGGAETQWWFSFSWQNQSDFATALKMAHGEIDYKSPVVAKVLQQQLDVQKAGFWPKDRYSTPTFPDGSDDFVKGKAAMVMGLASTVVNYPYYIKALGDENLGVMASPGASYIEADSAYVWSVPKAAKNHDAALAYIQFASDPEAQKLLFQDGDMIPNDPRVDIDAVAPGVVKEILRLQRTGPIGLSAHPLLPPKVLAAYQTVMDEALQGRKTLADVQDAMQKAAG